MEVFNIKKSYSILFIFHKIDIFKKLEPEAWSESDSYFFGKTIS